MEKYAENIIASQPTIETESEGNKLNATHLQHLKGTIGSKEHLDAPNVRSDRDGTRLLIMSENTNRSMRLIDNGNNTKKSRSPPK